MFPRRFTSALLVAVLCAGGCTGEGKPTTPEKVVDYTRSNVRRSAEGASGTARRAGKRVTRAVGSKVADDDGTSKDGTSKAPAEPGPREEPK